MHPCDICEDVAISYGYNNLPTEDPKLASIGKQDLLNKFSELIRIEMASMGYYECLTFTLCSNDDLTKKLLREKDEMQIGISNPKTMDF